MTKPGWKNKILTIWAGESVSLLTSSILQMAIIWELTERTGSAAVLALATIAGFLPQAILGLFAGVYIDRHSRKRIIILADAFIALTSVALAAVCFVMELPIWFIMVILVLRSVGTALQEPAVSALTPMIVPEEALTKYAGYQQTFESVSYIISPALAALLYAIWPMWHIMLLDVAGAAVAIALLLPQKIAQSYVLPTIHESILVEAKFGFFAMRAQKGMLTLLLIGALYSIIYFPVGSLYPHMTMVYFGGGTAESGTVEAIFSTGTLLGSVILGALGNRIDMRRGIVGSIFFYGVGVLACGLLAPEGYAVFAILSFFMGATLPFYYGLTTAIYQLRIKEEFLGRAFSFSLGVRRLAMPVGMLLSGVFADTVGVNHLFAILGAASIALAFFAWASPSLRFCCKSGE